MVHARQSSFSHGSKTILNCTRPTANADTALTLKSHLHFPSEERRPSRR